MSDSSAVPPRPAARSLHPLASFAIKTVIVMVAATISLVIITDSLVSNVNEMLEGQIARLRYALTESTTLGETGTLTRVEQFLDRAVRLSEAIPAERQEKMLRNIRTLADRARPFILEAESAFSPQPPKDK